MQFTEHEMTTALHGLAKSFLTATSTDATDESAVPAPSVGEDRWTAMSKFERYTLVTRLSDFVIPVFMTLPEVTVDPGQRAEFTDQQILDSAQQSILADVEAGKIDESASHDIVEARARMSTVALSLLPIKARAAATDEETLADFVVPDSLEGL